ncbi:MAG: carboxymuconolactone decarboxylase family protein [Pseudomonadota bacterium]
MSDPERNRLETAGRSVREALGLELDNSAAPGMRTMLDELMFGGIWARPGLDLADRLVATIAGLAALERSAPLCTYATVALKRAALSADGVREIVIQAGLYTGFVAAEANLTAVNTVLPPVPDAEHWGPDEAADLSAIGASLMDEIHGPRARAGYASGSGAPTELYDLAIRYGYGLLWNRPGLERRQRFITTVAVFTALEQPTQLVKFSSSARDNGLSREQVIEVVMQTAPYCGFPRALNALSHLDAAG